MALLFAGGLAISGFTILRNIEAFDDGLALQAARRVVDGQVPYRDFLWPYGPAPAYLVGALFKVFGTSLLTARIVRVVVDASTALAVFALVARATPRAGDRHGIAWLPIVAWATAACAMAQPSGANPFAPALLFGLLAVLTASRGRPLEAGALCALAAAWRLDFGAYAAIGAVAAAAVRERRDLLRTGAAFAVATVVVYLPFVIADGPGNAWHDLIGRSAHDGANWRLPFPLGYDGSLRLWPPGSFGHDAKDVLAFYVPLLMVIGCALAAVALAARRLRVPPEAAGLAGLGLGMVAYLFSRTDEFHVAPLLVVLAALLPLVVPQAPRAVAVASLVVLAALFAYGATNRLSALFDRPRLSAIHIPVADGVRTDASEARAIEGMVRAVQRRVRPGDPIYAITRRSDLVRINDPLIYVLAERDNPAPQDFGLQTSASEQRKIVGVLERSKPRVIVRWTDPISTRREPNERGRPTGIRTVDRWVAGHYRLAERYGYYDLLVAR